MATNSPVFPMPEPHHFSDYGFDPQIIDYFQFQEVLEEAKRFKQRESSSTGSIDDTLHFNLQKPIAKDDPIPLSRKKKRNSASAAKNHHHRRRWWKTALFFFFKSRRAHSSTKPRPISLSGPIYITESLSGPSTPFRAYSGPLTSATKGELDFPYFNLRELNMDHPPPIYLVT